MPRVRKHLGWVTALVLPGIAAAQTRLSPALATMDIAPAGLTLTKGGDLRFPEGFPGQGSVNDNAAATWSVSNPQGVSLSISFALPTALSGPGTSTIPLTYGSTSGAHTLSPPGTQVLFNPTAGTTVTGASASGTIFLGQSFGGAADFVTATVGTVPSGNYRATIVLTVAVL